jgi:Tfp pilus assembly protein PilF
LYLLLTWGLAELSASWRYRRVVLAGVSATILVVLIFCARAQVSYWRNSEALWTHTLACTADNPVVRNNLGNSLLQAGRRDEAIAQFQQALKINPRNAEANNNLGYVFYKMGRYQEAMVQFQQALQLDPRFAEAHFNLGTVLLQQGQWDEATAHFQQALQINPNYEIARNNLGFVFLQTGRYQEAMVQFQQALQINPYDAGARFNLGFVLLRLGRADEAVVHYQRALQLNPGSVNILTGLAWVLATASPAALRDGHKAVDLAERANQTAGGEDPVILRTLAAAYAEDGRFDDAVRNAQNALTLARAAGKSKLAGQLDAQLKLYEAKQPFHQEATRFEN